MIELGNHHVQHLYWGGGGEEGTIIVKMAAASGAGNKTKVGIATRLSEVLNFIHIHILMIQRIEATSDQLGSIASRAQNNNRTLWLLKGSVYGYRRLSSSR